jgi:hypothetical protein
LYKYKDIARIFDFCLATHALASVYLSAVIIRFKRNQLLDSEEMSEVHVLYRDIDDINVDWLCKEAFELMIRISPEELVLKHKNEFLNEYFLYSSPVFQTQMISKLIQRKKQEEIIGNGLAALLTGIGLFVIYLELRKR